ncbi:alpha/beta fold hydrolase [Actinoplanes ianthinogenes]|uniref:alpha/beta fold hydrolase n=1 Tax=Actinoplanes ianthinogenes TaxID=122358 RepID=UPI00167021E9|nr:alpha/beta fold hydrolase [Actinoplanes ianthinogenes]
MSVLTFMILLTGACTGEPAWGTVQEAAGERQRVLCQGTAGPAVVLVHGIGDHAGSASFADLIDRLPDDRRVCRYDRPGTGDSPAPSRSGRDATQLSAELDSVVRQADPDHPVVLLGHSFGSYPVLHYTAQHRDRVCGVVLADGVDPQLGLLAALGAPAWDKVSMAAESLDLPAVQEQTAAAVTGARQAFATLPLTVIRREKNVSGPWLAAQERLAGLAAGGRLVVAAGAGHEVPRDAPAVVADEIGRLSC